MKLYQPEFAGMTVWQVADPKTSKGAFTATRGTAPPPNASYGHPIGRFDADGVYWTFCPNAGDEDPNSPRSSRYVKHPHALEEQRIAVRSKAWGNLSSMGSYKETQFD